MDELTLYAFETIAGDTCIPQDKKIRVLKQCLELGVDINHNDSAILFSVIFCNNYDVVYFLIDNGINVTARDNKALMDACGDRTMMKCNDKLKIMKLLLSYGADPNAQNNYAITVLTSQLPKFDITKLLIENKMDLFAHNNILFESVCRYGDIEFVKYLINMGVNCANITSFIFYGSTEVKKLLLDNGYNPNTICYDMCLLEHKLCYYDIDSCKLLFEYGADIKYCYNIINKKCDIFRGIRAYGTEVRTQLIDLFAEHGLDITGVFDK
jgi:hypothetical protein